MPAMTVTTKKQLQKLIEDLQKEGEVTFTKYEMECLLKRFRTMTNNKLDRSKFRDVLHNEFGLTDDVLMDRIFRVFDKDGDGFLDMREWIKGLHIFLKGTTEQKTKFCFEVYDMNNDSYILKEEMYQFLKSALVKHVSDEDPDEGIRELVDICMKKLDKNMDGKVSYDDFKEAVSHDSLLLELLGQCIPAEKQCQVFEATFTARSVH